MKTNEIREKFLSYFEDHGHTRVKSDSLVPQNDPSLLFTGAGMNQFKDYFLGLGKLPYTRATSSQKCLRTGDVERVGRTAAHQTFFEMLGNFSFGDYFKRETIEWAWEFLTEVLDIPQERLSVSTYVDDDEAYDIWKDEIGVPEERIYRYGESENFWPASAPSKGPNGPCGPCSEIFYDFGLEFGCGQESCQPDCDCDRFVEIWNLVFTQYDRQDDGSLEPLPQKNIDTGMGLERISAVMQDVYSNFDTEEFQAIIQRACDLIGVEYSPRSETGAKLRRIADHTRAVTFLIADGVMPDNVGRGYVERRILRLALRDAIALGRNEPFMFELVPVIAETMGDAYPAVRDRADNIARIIKHEEESFLRNAEEGQERAEKKIAELKEANAKVFPGDFAFKLFDTYGFPVEFLRDVLSDHDIELDEAGFKSELEKQRKRSQEGSNISSEIFQGGPLGEMKDECTATEFVGYTTDTGGAEVQFLIKGDWGGGNLSRVDSLIAGDKGVVLLNRTPFYGESGGQVGDTGMFTWADGEAVVTDTQKLEGFFLHVVEVTKGSLNVSTTLEAKVDSSHRVNTARHHTATHLLHAALRQTLGTHVEQAGSLVAPDRLRFDFTHFEEVNAEQLEEIDRFVNRYVQDALAVEEFQTSLEDARSRGAMALFGEKYDDNVRVIQVGDVSMELCGGIHVASTGQIGLFKITHETAVGSGTRRIEAVAGPEAIEWLEGRERMVRQLALMFSTSAEQLVERVEKLEADHREQKHELNRLKKELAAKSAGDLQSGVEEISGVRVLAQAIDHADANQLRKMIDDLIQKDGLGVACLASAAGEKPVFVIGVHDDQIGKGVKAGDLARAVGQAAGGGGGGKPSMAQAGGASAESIPLGIEAFLEAVRNTLGQGVKA